MFAVLAVSMVTIKVLLLTFALGFSGDLLLTEVA